ncbi:hypothetical protein AGMMS49992_08020 [Clostridia bacterium]|nr:hypothetical protein AGMMS49992_08020 [Clostridia bacterium]
MNSRAGEKLTALRLGRGLSRDELAAQLNVGADTIETWEQGRSLPDTQSLISIAKLFNISLDELLLAEEPLSVQADTHHSYTVDTIQTRSVEDDFEKWRANRRETYATDDGGAPADVTADDYSFKVGGTKVRISHAAFPYPIIVTGAYLLAGFLFNWWHPGWLLFLTIPLYYTMPDFETMPRRKALMQFPYPVLVTLVYLVLGCLFDWWHPWWILFLTVPLYYIFAANADSV